VKIAFLGGSFDPVHFGHLCIAQDALGHLQLDRVVFVPAAKSPLKPGNIHAEGRYRLDMLRLALEGDARFDVSEIDLKRGGVSYTVDTVLQLKKELPGDRLFWILGSDQLALLPRWERAGQLVREIEFICLDRPGCQVSDPEPVPGLRLHRCQGHLMQISSTEIRDRARRGLSLECFMPHKAIVYLSQNHLYL
jgi:nicotinate-nucleotide adenylyltransferase